MKRFRYGEEGDNELANVLMLLARGRDSGGEEMSGQRVFECKTCSRQFSSFQALGGHRASHKKPRVVDDGDAKLGVISKPKVHECSVCGLEFAVGQALGGHMRRHRAEGIGNGDKRLAEKKRVPWLDLNLPPLEDINDQKLQGLEFKNLDNKTTMVGCFM